MLPQILLLYGQPFAYPWDALYQPLFGGDLQPPSTTEIVVTDGDNFRVVFEGNFTVVGGDVTGGTVTGFEAFTGTTEMVDGTNFSIDAAALFDALQMIGSSFSHFDLIFGQAIKWIGSEFVDGISGTDFGDKIVGRAGSDELYGYDGDDLIKGGKGKDLLAGNDGNDILYGNAGRDFFDFRLDPANPPIGIDKIKDFTVGEDMIGILASDLKAGLLDPKYFHKGTEAASPDQVIIYDKSTGRLLFDVDGTGIEAQFQFAKVTPGSRLHASDFMVETLFA
jgi:serralysin